MRSTPVRHVTEGKDKIPFLQGRPERLNPIDRDDVLNLQIALGLHEDAVDLCKDPHLFSFHS